MKGTGIFFDGLTSARRAVTVDTRPDALLVRDADNRDELARWPYGELEELAAPEGVLRVTQSGAKRTARLEVRDLALAAAIDDASLPVDRSGAARAARTSQVVGLDIRGRRVARSRRGVRRAVLADRIAPLIPLSAERVLGEAVNIQARKILDTDNAGSAFTCGIAASGGRRPRRARQARAQARSRGRAAYPADGDRGPAQRSQRDHAAGRPHLCIRRHDPKIRDR